MPFGLYLPISLNTDPFAFLALKVDTLHLLREAGRALKSKDYATVPGTEATISDLFAELVRDHALNSLRILILSSAPFFSTPRVRKLPTLRRPL